MTTTTTSTTAAAAVLAQPPSKPRTTLSGAQLAGLALLLVIACALPFVLGNYRVFQLTLALAYAIAILGLNMLTGYNGQISLGHGAFFAIGAYVAAILMDKTGMPYWATIPFAGLACFVAGFLFGLPALRLEGLYLALATFALGVAMPQILKHKALEHWTGGAMGVVIIKPDPPQGLPLSQDQWLYFFTLAWTVLLVIACALPFVLGNYRVFQLTLALAYAIAILGLNMLTGYNGQISLGHGAFFAIGAYVAAILMDKAGMPYWMTIPFADPPDTILPGPVPGGW